MDKIEEKVNTITNLKCKYCGAPIIHFGRIDRWLDGKYQSYGICNCANDYSHKLQIVKDNENGVYYLIWDKEEIVSEERRKMWELAKGKEIYYL